MVKTKNGVSKLVALVLILTLAVASLLLALSTNRKSVYAATTPTIVLYEKGTTTVKKSQETLISEGIISIDGENLVVLNKDGLDGDIKVTLGNVSSKQMFKNCTKLTGVDLDMVEWDEKNKKLDFTEMFYGCTALETVDIYFGSSDMFWSKDVSWSTTNMFKGCGNINAFEINRAGADGGTLALKGLALTYEDLALEYDNITCAYDYKDFRDNIVTKNEAKSRTDDLICGGLVTLSGYNPTVETPSTGVETSLISFGVTAIILVAICYVLVKKKKVR